MLELCQADQAQLLVIDVQERLCAAMPPVCLVPLTQNLKRLAEAARLLAIPVMATEQYPKGLGRTQLPVLDALPPDQAFVEKTCFSCCAAPGFADALAPPEHRRQLVLAGVEAHICVLQTAAGLQALGYRVWVVADAVCSRDPANKDNALRRMADGGIQISNTESVVFEWLGGADHPQFKALSGLFR